MNSEVLVSCGLEGTDGHCAPVLGLSVVSAHEGVPLGSSVGPAEASELFPCGVRELLGGCLCLSAALRVTGLSQ